MLAAVWHSNCCVARRPSFRVLQCRRYTQAVAWWGSRSRIISADVWALVVAPRGAINHGVNHENKVGELQLTFRWCAVKQCDFVRRLCARFVWLNPRVHKFSKNLGASSKFETPEGRHEASSTLRTHRHIRRHLTKFRRPGFAPPWLERNYVIRWILRRYKLETARQTTLDVCNWQSETSGISVQLCLKVCSNGTDSLCFREGVV